MTHASYLRPSWFDRCLGALPFVARLMSWLTGDAVLQVRGRHSGRLRTTLARVIVVDGRRYIVAIRGQTQWARNLRAAGEAIVFDKGVTSRMRATEAQSKERQAAVRAFLASSSYAPTRRIMTEVLPEADQHPVFRLESVE